MLPLLPYASVTESLADFATRVVGHGGLPGIFGLMTLESACIPVPSEATMLFAGFNVSGGRHFSLLAITIAGVLGNLLGSWIAYAVGYYGRVELLERHGRALHVSPAQLARADRWFARWGAWAVFFSRMLPVVRTFISLPAGVARMPFWRFSLLTLLGCLPWVFLLGLVGREAGANWKSWKNGLHYVDYACAAALVAGVVWLLVSWWRGRGAAGTAADAANRA